MGKASRDRLIAESVTAHGYGQMDVASFLGLHYSIISRILTVNKAQILKDMTLCPCAGLCPDCHPPGRKAQLMVLSLPSLPLY